MLMLLNWILILQCIRNVMTVLWIVHYCLLICLFTMGRDKNRTEQLHYVNIKVQVISASASRLHSKNCALSRTTTLPNGGIFTAVWTGLKQLRSPPGALSWLVASVWWQGRLLSEWEGEIYSSGSQTVGVFGLLQVIILDLITFQYRSFHVCFVMHLNQVFFCLFFVWT